MKLNKHISIAVTTFALLMSGSVLNAKAATVDQNATASVKGGELLLSVGGTIALPPITLDGTTKVTQSTIPPVTILDATGTGDGWKVSVSATPFKEVTPVGGFKAGTTAKQFNVETFNLATKTIVPKDGSSITGVTANTTRQSLNGSEIVLANASKGNGLGKYELQFAPDALQLQAIHTKAYVDDVNYAGQKTPYTSTLTWAVTVAP